MTRTDDGGGAWFEHEGHRVWYSVIATDAPGTPLLLVHGGPGMPHDYLAPLSGLTDERPVVFYDQFGCGRSDRSTELDDYSVQLFIDELVALRVHLGLDRVHLLAHSYGGALALEYALGHPDSGVVSLVLSNSFPSISGLVAGWQRRLDELDPAHAAALRAGDPTPAYGEALGEFVERFVLPGTPPPELAAAQAGMGAEVYAAMHGSSWFSPDGRWKDWDATPRLGELSIPVLAISGERDQCVPDLSAAIADGAPHGELVVLDAAHLPMFEAPGEYLAAVREFLRRSEPAAHSPAAP